MKWLALALLSVAAQAAEFDVIFKNARLVDGTGAPWFRADLAVKDGRIARIARRIEASATQIVDARERVLAPGFIDVHTHVEGVADLENFARDGVTTIITGNCGSSQLGFNLTSPHVHIATLVGHNTVRRKVMGLANRPATPAELDQMKALVEQAMRAGALGLSTGLEYIPGAYSPREEIAELAKVAARYGGVYATHMRYESEKVLEAIDEALFIGKEAGIRVQISHLKQDTKRFWGTSQQIIDRLNRARADGIDVTADQYPYDRSSTGLSIRIPAWALADGKLKDRLATPTTKAEIVAEMKRMVADRGWGDYSFATVISTGKTIPETAQFQGRTTSLDDQIETIFDLVLAGNPGMVSQVMSDEDIERIMRWPHTAIASDAGFGHPRAFGTNARILARYQHILPLEEAVRRMTSLPARTFGLRDRGLLREGFAADLVLFDPAEVRDNATYSNPRLFSTGFTQFRGQVTQPPNSVEILIKNARVLDGANAWFRADVAINNGRISAIGKIDSAAAKVIDAAGRYLAPGFIDVHTHADRSIERHPDAANFVRDGVTTAVTGNCGGSNLVFPLPPSAISLPSLVGHNTIREKVMGRANRAATSEELARMKALVAQAMRDGAVGLSTGLEYVPGVYAPTEEIVELARVACRAGGIYATHMRDEGEKVLDAMQEAIRVGREARCPVQISHLKQDTRRLWGSSAQQLDLIANARKEGIDVAADQYPYDAYSTGLSFLLPTTTGGDVIRKTAATIRAKGYEDLSWVRVAQWPQRQDWEGLTISEVHLRYGRSPGLENEVATLIDVIERGATSGVYRSMSEEDIVRILQSSQVAVASDGTVVAPGEGRPHPRSYGTNARVLARYVREKKALTLEQAIFKMTALPARSFMLLDRGLIAVGMQADLVLFDLAKIQDNATFDDPHQYSSGFDIVLVSGQIAYDAAAGSL